MQIRVKVFAGARRERIMQQGNGDFVVRTTAPATDNKANLAVTKMLCDFLGIKKSQLILVQGEKNRDKIFQIIY
jgi:uncharacterized protein YggU (UPF0235/DUF167 family)